MRILHVAWEYPPLVYGGLGRHVHALTLAQAAEGHEVVVVTQASPEAPADELAGRVRVVRGAAAPEWEFSTANLVAWVAEFDANLAAAAQAVVSDWRPDVVHCHDWMTTRAGSAAAEAADVGLFATIHATERGRHQGHLYGDVSLTVDGIERFLCHRADALIVCSAAMRYEVQQQFAVPGDRVTVIPNGVDQAAWSVEPAACAEARARWLPEGGSGLIVYTGRLEAEKGIFTLLDAMPAVLATRPGTRLVLAGSGGQQATFDQVCRERGLVESVVRSGWLPEGELKALIGAADAAVVPSLYEPFGMVALEAMSLGAPVVASRTGGLADIVIDGETGRSVPPGDPVALAGALCATMADPIGSRVMAAEARALLEQRYDWGFIARDTVNSYRAAAELRSHAG
ncbi:MAG: hypothetical protein RLZ55_1665 [Actinomycetota bacterium]